MVAQRDRFMVVYGMLLLHGIGALLPWNMLINSDSYFVDYKLKVANSSTALENYRKNFLSYVGIASKAPNILFQLVNMFLSNQSEVLSTRILLTLIAQSLIFVITIVLAIIDSQQWPELFFWVTMLCTIAINIANGLYQTSLYGIASKLPMRYTNSVTAGYNLSGVIASIALIISIALAPTPKQVATYFFSFAVFVLVVCFINELFIRRNNFYLHYMAHEIKSSLVDSTSVSSTNESLFIVESKSKSKPKSLSSTISNSEDDEIELLGHKKYLYVFKRVWVQLLNTVLIYFVSFSIFPAVQANIKSRDNFISDKYFAPVFCFLLFNTFAMIGNIFAQLVRKPGPDYIIIFACVRLVFIPFFLFCNYNPDDRLWTVYIGKDWVYIIGAILMALSSGYFSSLCMMYAPKSVPLKYSPIAAMMASLVIILGILLGVNFSLIYPWIIHR